MMKIRVISSLSALYEFKQEWDGIFDDSISKNPFLSWEWSYYWAKNMCPEGRLLILAVYNDAKLAGIAPLFLGEGSVLTAKKSVARFIGDELADYMDILVRSDRAEVVSEVLDFLLNMKEVGKIKLVRFPESAPNLELLSTYLVQRQCHHEIGIDFINPAVSLTGTWEDYYSSLSKGFRRGMNGFRNRLARTGDVTFHRYETEEDMPMKELFEMHRNRQEYKVGKSIFENAGTRQLFLDLAEVFGERGWMETSAMRVDGEIVSAVCSLKCRGVYYYWIPVFDPEYIKFAPGKLHIKNLIEHCYTDNYEQFDFMIGDEEYKFHWSKTIANNYAVTIYKGLFLYKLNKTIVYIKEYLRGIRDQNVILKNWWKKVSKI
ncbi:MAG: GNAT family N-acetyltransferase [Candidatus Brocadiales bacterium]|nr:GNAT family N-acetyltransferase [Candidatus Brocadiales bacterium]